MADYYPLIARAIAGLDPNAPGESRRALYERARAALIAQLRGVQPPLSESEITRERLSLEEAVRRVESEAAQRARDALRTSGPPRAGDAFRRAGARSAAEPAQPGAEDAAQISAPSSRPSTPPPSRNDRPPLGQEERQAAAEPPRPQRSLRGDATLRPQRPQAPSAPLQIGMAEPQLPAGRERAPTRRGADNAMTQASVARGFRDITADADDLGHAAAQASRAARKSYANVPSPSPEFDRLEPNIEDHGVESDAPYSYEETMEQAERYAPRQRIGSDRERAPKRVRSGVFPFRSAIAIGVVLILAGAAILGGKSAVTMVRGLVKSHPVAQASNGNVGPLSKPKIADRVGQSAPAEEVAPVAQRAVLYDEDPNNPQGKQYVGTVIWRTEKIAGSGNQPGDIAVRADIEVPEAKFKMTMSFRRNTDKTLPASHTAELTFVLPPDFNGGGVSNVPGILMKSSEQARGTPLAGLAVKVTDGFFLIGLSNVDADRTRNIALLKERPWFDVPLVYNNQRRAIVAIEKGEPGRRAFAKAFAAWGE
ncbi:MAG: hypothetical protein ACREDL_05150 [Bradyrhizobium sp.]